MNSLDTQALLAGVPTKSIAIMVCQHPNSHSSHTLALRYCQTLIQLGHKIDRLFFYHNAVSIGSSLSVYSQDETNINQAWLELIIENNIDAVLCIASALKRGIIDENEAKRYKKDANNLASGFRLAGLGDWIESMNRADQHIVF